MMTRRVLLRGSAIVMAGSGMSPAWLARAAGAGDKTAKRKILIAIFQRGAADGLNIVAPFGDKRYRELRPTLAVAAPTTGQTANGLGQFSSIDLDGYFALHPQMQALKPLWERKQVAFVQAAGSPDPSRSHFDAQEFMESGTPGKSLGDGWLNRALAPADDKTSPVRAIALSSELPRTLRGSRAAIAVNDAQQFQMGDQQSASILERMYAQSASKDLSRTGTDAFAAIKTIKTVNQQPYNPAGGAQYFQGGELGRSLQQIARLIKADVGVEAAFAEMGGWDHHGNEAGQMGNMLGQFSRAIAAFSQDMGDRMEDIVMVTMSEFGRTAQENGDGGTDHGHGGVMMVFGGPVQGGKVYGKWPGLEKEQLFEGRDLAVTTDYREVLGELVIQHMGAKNLGDVFPGYQPGPGLGLLKV